MILHVIYDGSNAEVGQVIAGTKLVGFLTPGMSSENGARYMGLIAHY